MRNRLRESDRIAKGLGFASAAHMDKASDENCARMCEQGVGPVYDVTSMEEAFAVFNLIIARRATP